MFHTRQSWTNSFTLIIKFLRLGGKIIPSNTNLFRMMTDVEIPTWTPILATGINCTRSKNKTIDGEWIYPNNINYKTHTKYIYYIHGGAFCLNKIGTYREFLYKIAKETNTVIFSINYRRAPEYKYPIPLNDCLNGYIYLLSEVETSEKIILMGDSAGGNLLLNLLAQLIENNLSNPSKCVLISPWVDLTDWGDNSSWKTNKKYDFVRPELAKYFSLEYIDQTETNLYDLSPLYFKNEILSKFPSMLIEYGECEVLHDQIHEFCHILKNLNVDIKHYCRPDMVHVFPLFHFTGISHSNDFFSNLKKYI